MPSVSKRLFALAWILFGLVPSARADQAVVLPDPMNAAYARVHLIRHAAKEVIVSSYIFKNDRAGWVLVSEMCAARDRGVRVKLVLDGVASHLSTAMRDYLASKGVEIYVYHPLDWMHPIRTLSTLVKRMHDKLIIVDGEHLIVGDRNIGNEYFGLTQVPFVSRDVYVRGKSASDAADYVESLTRSAEVAKWASGKTGPKALAKAEARIAQARRDRDDRMLGIDNDWFVGLGEVEEARFFHDPVGLKGKAPGVFQEIIDAINSAKSSIDFENPYIMPPPELEKALTDAAKRGVRIRVITNSYASNDVKLAGSEWLKVRDFYASLGAEIWEYPGTLEAKRFILHPLKFLKSRQSLHAKTMVIDRKSSFVMSSNFDPRSKNLNMEVGENIVGETFADSLIRDMEKDLQELEGVKVASGGRMTRNLPQDQEKIGCFVRALSGLLKPQL